MAKDENNDKNYAYITIVAIVAIVAVFVMFAGSGSKETPQTMVYQPEIPSGDLVGDARRVAYDSAVRDSGVVQDRTAEFELTPFDKEMEAFDREMEEYDWEMELLKREVYDDFEEDIVLLKKSDFVPVDISRIPKLRNGCTPLSQSWFNNLNSDFLITPNQGCVTLVEDVMTSYTVSIQGNLEFWGDGYEITMLNPTKPVLVGWDNSKFKDSLTVKGGETGFVLHDNSQVHDSTATNTGRGFLLYHNSQVHDSTASNNNKHGFQLHSNSKVYGSTSSNNNWYGFLLYSSSRVYYSIATNNNMQGFRLLASSLADGSLAADNSRYGFHLEDNSQVHVSTAINNAWEGFYLKDNSQVHVSTASNNNWNGFYSEDNSIIVDSHAENNNKHGFYLKDNSEVYSDVYGSTASNNNWNGFHLLSSSKAFDSSSLGNNRYGFYLGGSSEVHDSTASNNNWNGFHLLSSSKAFDSSSLVNNRHGFYLSGSSEVRDSISINNELNGFYLRTRSKVYDSTARFNNVGIRVDGNLMNLIFERGNENRGIEVGPGPQNPSVIGGEYCDNEVNMQINGGILQGNILTYPLSGFGAYSGNPTLNECSDYDWGVMIGEVGDLWWQKEVSLSTYNYADSLNYCQSLTLGGRTWDVPTRAEMVKLRNYACDNKESGPPCSYCNPYGTTSCISGVEVNLQNYLNNVVGFSGFTSVYWTKTMSGASDAWHVNLRNGHVTFSGVVTDDYRVVCVSRN